LPRRIGSVYADSLAIGTVNRKSGVRKGRTGYSVGFENLYAAERLIEKFYRRKLA
jgi:hypothetical protein